MRSPRTCRAPASADALLAEIRLGLPSIGAPVVEHFVAQMLNLDLLDAVSFDKGCYPGQEVIARVRHLGSVKRRMRRYACDAETPPAPGAAVVTADGANVGEVVRAERAERGSELLAVVEHSLGWGALGRRRTSARAAAALRGADDLARSRRYAGELSPLASAGETAARRPKESARPRARTPRAPNSASGTARASRDTRRTPRASRELYRPRRDIR